MERDTRQRLLDLVVARLGWNATALRLHIQAETLDNWMSGAARIPNEHLPMLVDLIDETNAR
jgi:hypothetical protein